MVNVKKVIRFCSFIALWLYASYGMAMEKPMPFPLQLPFVSAPAAKSISIPANFRLLSPLLNRLSRVDILHCGPRVIDVMKNNPKIFVPVLATSLAAGSYCMISEKRWTQLMEKCTACAAHFANNCGEIMPTWLQNCFIMIKTLFLKPLAGATVSYVKYNKTYAVLSIASCGLGYAADSPKAGASLATLFFLLGLNQYGFNRLEGKMDEHYKALAEKIQELKNTIDGLGNAFGDLQKTADDIQQKQNDCIDMLKLLAANDIKHNNKIDGLIQQIEENDKALTKKFEDMEVTAQVERKEIRQELQQLRNCQQVVLSKVDNMSIDLVNTIKLLNIVSIKSDDGFLLIGKVLDKTGKIEKNIELLETQGQFAHDKLEGLKDQLSAVEQLIHDKLQSVVDDLEAVKKNQVEMQNVQFNQGNTIVQMHSTLEDVSKSMHEQNSALLEKLNKFEEEQRNLTQILLEQKKTIENLSSSQNVIINGQKDISKKIDEVADRGDQRLDKILDVVQNPQVAIQLSMIENKKLIRVCNDYQTSSASLNDLRKQINYNINTM